MCPPRLGFTWNPASGCNNLWGCAVRRRGACWAERIVKRLGRVCPLCPTFEPHLHDGRGGTPNRLSEPLRRKRPSTITPVSTGDLFGLPRPMTYWIMETVWSSPWHLYALLTKLPHRARLFRYPDHVWFGVTVNEQNDVWRLYELERIEVAFRWAIFEPLYSAIDRDLSFLDWIVIGPQTRPTLQPRREWVQSILDNAPDVPVFMKPTLDWSPRREESPRVKR